MKIIIQLITAFVFLSACKATSQSTSTYHPIVQKAKETSLYTENVNWSEVNKKFVQLANRSSDLREWLQYLINSLNDKHATFRSVSDQSVIVGFTGKINSTDTRKPKFVNEIINDITSKFEYALLEDDIGYLKIVGIAPFAVEENANLIRNGLIELKNKDVKKWIVDLRYNGGGDMNPMLAGLAPLIGEGFIGGSIDKSNELHQVYKISQGQFYDNDRLVVDMQNTPLIKTEEKVAVLLSRYTISSGELTAIAFKGRPNTRFIGEKTGGYTTGNGWEQVSDKLIMCISESVFIDRNKVTYDNRVGVDEPIEFNHNTSIDGDNQVEKAIEWLNK